MKLHFPGWQWRAGVTLAVSKTMSSHSAFYEANEPQTCSQNMSVDTKCRKTQRGLRVAQIKTTGINTLTAWIKNQQLRESFGSKDTWGSVPARTNGHCALRAAAELLNQTATYLCVIVGSGPHVSARLARQFILAAGLLRLWPAHKAPALPAIRSIFVNGPFGLFEKQTKKPKTEGVPSPERTTSCSVQCVCAFAF